MGKILIIGVGGGGINAIRHMKDIGIDNAEYLTVGDYSEGVAGIPHLNLITLSGRDSIPAGSDERVWKELAEECSEVISSTILDNLRGIE